MRGVGAEEFVGIHGRGGQPIAGLGKPAGGVTALFDDVGPERLLLGGIEEQAGIGGARLPCSADEGGPGLDVGRGPGGEAFAAAETVVGGGDGAGGAIAGGYHIAARAEPFVDAEVCA